MLIVGGVLKVLIINWQLICGQKLANFLISGSSARDLIFISTLNNASPYTMTPSDGEI